MQSPEEQKRTEALGEKLFLLLKDRPRHRALLTNECKLNHSTNFTTTTTMTTSHSLGSNLYMIGNNNNNNNDSQQQQQQMIAANSNNINASTSQEDETFYTRELIQIYGQPIVPSFHKYFNYQLSNTHYGYRTLRRLLNCDILKKFVKVKRDFLEAIKLFLKVYVLIIN